jgi:hypothetical protein
MKIATPVGDLKYCSVTGKGRENFDGDGYIYQASVILPKKQGEELYGKICEFFVENKPAGFSGDEPMNKIMRPIEGDKKNVMFTFNTNTTFQNEDGDVIKTKVKIKNSKDQERELPDGVGIGDGSRGAISGKLKVYGNRKKAGVSMFLNALQIIKFVEYKDNDGFDAHEDGDFDDFTNTSKSDFPDDDEHKKKKKKKKK